MLLAAGEGYNRTIKGAAVLAPLEYKSPMEIYPGAIFHYRPCSAGAAPVAYLRADLMAVPSTRRDNASAYAIHSWMRVRTSCSYSPVFPPFSTCVQVSVRPLFPDPGLHCM